MSALRYSPNPFLEIEPLDFLIGLISVLPYCPREISNGFPLYENRTRAGWISTTLTPSIIDPSEAILPLIIARRSPGSSCQMIPDNFSDGGDATDTLVAGSVDFFIISVATSGSLRIISRLAFFPDGGIDDSLFFASSWIFAGGPLISPVALLTGSRAGAADVTC
jgi:hypothetical protein